VTIPAARYQLTFIVIAVATFSYSLVQSFVTPILALLGRELHTSAGTATWIATAYLLSASIFTPIMGRIGDAVGKQRVFVVTMLALGLGSLVAAMAPNIEVMIVARVIQGVGGGVFPLGFGIIRDEFPSEKVVGAVGVVASLGYVGGAVGIVLSGPIVDALSWHWLFWIPAVVCLASAVAARRYIPESPVRAEGRVSWLSAASLSLWLLALLLGIGEAPDWGWGSPRVLGLLAVSVVVGIAWVRSETRAASPLIDMRMMRLKPVWTSNVVTFVIGTNMYATIAFVPELAQAPTSTGYGFGASITQSGLILLPGAVFSFTVGSVASQFAERIGGKWVVLAGCLVDGFGLIMFAAFHAQKWELFIGCGLQGIGIGLAYPALSALVVRAVPTQQTGVAGGMNANIRTIGGAIGTAAMGSVIAGFVRADGLPRETGYTIAFWMLAGALVLGAAVALIIPNSRVAHTDGLADLADVADRDPRAAAIGPALTVAQEETR
jgi:EmrB/QacA subfamily drug resistance transporter